MSTVSASASKGEKAKGKYVALDINNLYKGKSLENPKTSVLPKHGLQSLGKVGALRRIPPPTNLPSLKSENSGNNFNINLVPSGGQGWGTSSKEKGKTEESQSAPSPQIPTTAVVTTSTSTQPQISQNSTPQPPVTAPAPGKTWSTVTSGQEAGGPEQTFLAHQSPFFRQEFPKLAGGDVQTEGTRKSTPDSQFGPGLSLRPQTEGSWGRGALQQPTPSANPQQSNGSGGNGNPLETQPTGPKRGGSNGQQYRNNMMPAYMNNSRNFSTGFSAPNNHSIPSSKSNYYNTDNRPRPSRPISDEHRPPAIITEKDLKGFDRILQNDNQEGWSAAREEIDYNAKLVFSDDEEAAATAPQRKETAKSEVVEDQEYNKPKSWANDVPRSTTNHDLDWESSNKEEPWRNWNNTRQQQFDPSIPSSRQWQQPSLNNRSSQYDHRNNQRTPSKVNSQRRLNDEDDLWTQRRRQNSEEMTETVERTRQRREEEERHYSLSNDTRSHPTENSTSGDKSNHRNNEEPPNESSSQQAFLFSKQFQKNVPPRFQKQQELLRQQSSSLSSSQRQDSHWSSSQHDSNVITEPKHTPKECYDPWRSEDTKPSKDYEKSGGDSDVSRTKKPESGNKEKDKNQANIREARNHKRKEETFPLQEESFKGSTKSRHDEWKKNPEEKYKEEPVIKDKTLDWGDTPYPLEPKQPAARRSEWAGHHPPPITQRQLESIALPKRTFTPLHRSSRSGPTLTTFDHRKQDSKLKEEAPILKKPEEKRKNDWSSDIDLASSIKSSLNQVSKSFEQDNHKDSSTLASEHSSEKEHKKDVVEHKKPDDHSLDKNKSEDNNSKKSEAPRRHGGGENRDRRPRNKSNYNSSNSNNYDHRSGGNERSSGYRGKSREYRRTRAEPKGPRFDKNKEFVVSDRKSSSTEHSSVHHSSYSSVLMDDNKNFDSAPKTSEKFTPTEPLQSLKSETSESKSSPDSELNNEKAVPFTARGEPSRRGRGGGGGLSFRRGGGSRHRYGPPSSKTAFPFKQTEDPKVAADPKESSEHKNSSNFFFLEGNEALPPHNSSRRDNNSSRGNKSDRHRKSNRYDSLPPRLQKRHAQRLDENNKGGSRGGSSRNYNSFHKGKDNSDQVNEEWETASESSDVGDRKDFKKSSKDDFKSKQSESNHSRSQRHSDDTFYSNQQKGSSRGFNSRGSYRNRGERRSNNDRPERNSNRNSSSLKEHKNGLSKPLKNGGENHSDSSNKKPKQLDSALPSSKNNKVETKEKATNNLEGFDLNNYAGVVVIDDRPEEEGVHCEDGFQEVTSKKRHKIVDEGKKGGRKENQARGSKSNSWQKQNRLPPRFAKQRENNQSNKTSAPVTEATLIPTMWETPTTTPVATPASVEVRPQFKDAAPPTVNAWEKPISLRPRSPQHIPVNPPANSLPQITKLSSEKSSSFDQHDSGIDVSDQPPSTTSSQRSSPSTECKTTAEAAKAELGAAEMDTEKPMCTVIFENKNYKLENAALDKFGAGNKISSLITTKADTVPNEIKLDFCTTLEQDLSQLSKTIGRPQETNPSDDLNFKIASVKKVWETVDGTPTEGNYTSTIATEYSPTIETQLLNKDPPGPVAEISFGLGTNGSNPNGLTNVMGLTRAPAQANKLEHVAVAPCKIKPQTSRVAVLSPPLETQPVLRTNTVQMAPIPSPPPTVLFNSNPQQLPHSGLYQQSRATSYSTIAPHGFSNQPPLGTYGQPTQLTTGGYGQFLPSQEIYSSNQFRLPTYPPQNQTTNVLNTQQSHMLGMQSRPSHLTNMQSQAANSFYSSNATPQGQNFFHPTQPSNNYPPSQQNFGSHNITAAAAQTFRNFSHHQFKSVINPTEPSSPPTLDNTGAAGGNSILTMFQSNAAAPAVLNKQPGGPPAAPHSTKPAYYPFNHQAAKFGAVRSPMVYPVRNNQPQYVAQTAAGATYPPPIQRPVIGGQQQPTPKPSMQIMVGSGNNAGGIVGAGCKKGSSLTTAQQALYRAEAVQQTTLFFNTSRATSIKTEDSVEKDTSDELPDEKAAQSKD